MSYTELHTGELMIYSESFDRENFKKLIKSEGLQTDYDYEQDDFVLLTDMYDVNKFVYNKGKLYRFVEHTEHSDADFLHETEKNDDIVKFTYLFYNGGTCFSEMLEEGLNKI